MVDPTTPRRFRPIEEELPALYRRDPSSWRQIGEYLAPLNQLLRTVLLGVDDLDAWLSPAAKGTTPPGLHAQVGHDGEDALVRERRNEVLDLVASWMNTEFGPRSLWTLPEDEQAATGLIEDKAAFLRALPRLARTRSSPDGFLELLCRTFRLDLTDPIACPVLLEHFGFRAAGAGTTPDHDREPGPGIRCDLEEQPPIDDGIGNRVTLLVPLRPPFWTWRGWNDVVTWVERNAPAHLAVEVLPVSPGFLQQLHDDWLPRDFDLADLLREVARNVAPPEALHTHAPGDGDAPTPPRELGVTRLPRPTGSNDPGGQP